MSICSTFQHIVYLIMGAIMSNTFFTSVQSIRVADNIENQIKEAILSERLTTGDRLPPEKELSRIFETSRNSVREALRTLEKQGFIIIKQGAKGGAFIREADFSNVTSSISSMLMLKKVTIKNLTESRLIIEPEIARMAALRANRHDIKNLEKAIEDLRQVIERKQRSTPTNVQFHRIIGEACKNPVLHFVNKSLMDVLQKKLSEEFTLKLENNRLLLEQHIRIYEHLKTRNETGAYEEMRNHILNVEKFMKPMLKELNLSQ